MDEHVDILAQSEHMRKPFVASVFLHVGVFSAVLMGSYMSWMQAERWGDRMAGGGSVSVNPVASIPMTPREGLVNPLANDTQSRVPTPPPDQPKPPPPKEPERKAVEIPDKVKKLPKKRPSEVAASRQRFRTQEEPKPNQLYSSAGQALVSPMLGKPGAGGVGVGSGTPLGDRFGAYAALIQQLIAQRWSTHDVDPRLRTAPPAVVSFTLLRDGTVRDIRLSTSSGNRALDQSAQRAVYDVGKFPPLPPAYPGNDARIELWFQLQR
ncbi:MAG: TonB C-terminal domain-containing protein [Bryobacterales bacterium]|nr:TonB C-terminal domain-containing protein [Bryobacterales bacterium]